MTQYIIQIDATITDFNNNVILRSNGKAKVHPPAYCENDTVMLRIHLEMLAKMEILKDIRKIAAQDITLQPENFTKEAFRKAFDANQFQIEVFVLSIVKVTDDAKETAEPH